MPPLYPLTIYTGRERIRDLLPALEESLGLLDVSHFVKKANEQKEIVTSEEDLRVLRKAITAFTSLQHVQILRVQDQQDSMLLAYIRQHDELNDLVELRWPPACSHSTKTIGAALLSARSPCTRFSSPMLSPQSAMILADHHPNSFSALFERLTCLELHFDDGTDLDNRMRELSGLFRTVFNAASNMQAVHVGFPSHRPLSLSLEEIFHDVRWEKLRAFGIQAWKLDAGEIIALARRHRDRLKGLRLRDVMLKEGSMWKDVLGFLRNDMFCLDWVSLRRIGYARHFDEQWAISGAEIPDDPPGEASESDDESDWEPHADVNGTDSHSFSDESDGTHTDAGDTDDEHGPEANEMGFPSMSPDTPSSVPWCNCNGRSPYPQNPEELGDNGEFVTNIQRKLWEKWVVNRCPEHSTK